jgi:hypothetical protein
MKHIYYTYEEEPSVYDDETPCTAVVAESPEDARKISGNTFVVDAELDRDADELPLGEVDPIEGLKRRIYAWVDSNCPVCKRTGLTLYFNEYTNRVECSDCYDDYVDYLFNDEPPDVTPQEGDNAN